MKIYTRTGDTGETALFGGGRVPKNHRRVAAYGEVDELNALLGVALCAIEDERIRTRLEPLQEDLFALGAHLATPRVHGRRRPRLPPLPAARVEEFESWIDEADEELPALRSFILPGGAPGGAWLHLARTATRRAERAVVALAAVDEVDAIVLRYLNRLSDLLFVLARLENRRAGATETPWTPTAAEDDAAG